MTGRSPADDCGLACAPGVAVLRGTRTGQHDGLARPAGMRGRARAGPPFASNDWLDLASESEEEAVPCCRGSEAHLRPEGSSFLADSERPLKPWFKVRVRVNPTCSEVAHVGLTD